MNAKNQKSKNDRAEYIAHCREKDGEIQSLWCHLKEVSTKTGESGWLVFA